MKLISIPLLLGAFAGLPAHAASPAEQALQQFVDGVQTLSANFDQVQKDDKGQVLQKTSGRMWLARPDAASRADAGRFRWSYEKPYEQLIACDGQTIWLYDPDLSQVTVRPAKEALQGTPAQLLSQRTALTGQFRVEDAGREGDVQIVRLVPKAPDTDFQSVELWLAGGVPSSMRFVDPLGGVTDVRFRDVKKNERLDPELFRFEVPKGVEVIRAEGSP